MYEVEKAHLGIKNCKMSDSAHEGICSMLIYFKSGLWFRFDGDFRMLYHDHIDASVTVVCRGNVSSFGPCRSVYTTPPTPYSNYSDPITIPKP